MRDKVGSVMQLLWLASIAISTERHSQQGTMPMNTTIQELHSRIEKLENQIEAELMRRRAARLSRAGGIAQAARRRPGVALA